MSNLPTVHLGAGKTALHVSAGNGFTCVVLNDHSVKCWGYSNFNGQLGLDSTEDWGAGTGGRTMANLPTVNLGAGKTALKVAGGGSHNCALLNDRSVKCWGWNISGQLGQDSTDNWGSGTNLMANLNPVNLGADLTALDLVVGGNGSCVILNNGLSKCWGNGGAGKLGQDSTDNWGSNAVALSMANLNPIDLGAGKTVLKIIPGAFNHSCAILNDYSAKCWGSGGQGGLMLNTNSVVWGNGGGNLMTDLPTISFGAGLKALQIMVGSSTSCALLTSGEVKCFGYAGSTGLGYDNTTDYWGSNGTTLSVENTPAINLNP